MPSTIEPPTITAPELTFTLPDAKTVVSVRKETSQGSDSSNTYQIYSQNKLIGTWTTSPNVTTRISPAQVLDERAEHAPIQHFQAATTPPSVGDNPSSTAELESIWISIYALWLLLHDADVIPIAVSANSLATSYTLATGLAAPSPYASTDSQQNRILLLAREPFWQGAGTPDRFSWLRARPEASFPGFNTHLGAFASQMSFTRKGNVCTTHPLRPQKPSPGTILYSRYIVELGQHLQIIHIDANNPLHFEAYTKWQNSDRVNHGWRERGPDSKHAAYLASQLADPHTMSCIFLWDDEPAGYTEVGWAKEDNTAPFVASNCGIDIGEFDQNSHVLVGEEKFRGGKR